MKKTILLLSLAIISLEAKMEIKDLIQNDGDSYKQEKKSSYKKETTVKKKAIVEKKKSIVKKKKSIVKKKYIVEKAPIKKESLKNFSKKELKEAKFRMDSNRIKKTEKLPNHTKIDTDTIKPKRDIIKLLSLNTNDISIDKTVDVKTKKTLHLNDNYLESITNLVRETWNKSIFHSGEAKITLIMNTTKGKLEKIFVMSKSGDSSFKIDFRVFMRSISKKRFIKIKSLNGLIEIKLILKKQIEETTTFNKVSIYKNKKDKMYKDYLSYLVKNKGYSLEQIRKMLNSKKNTVTKNMLYAIYADYTKNNEEEARKYYEIVINNKLERFIKSTEGLYLADFALREGKNRLVLKILPRFSCQFMDEPEKNHCYYYRARALHHLGKEYEIPLNIVRYKLKEAKIFYQDVSNKKRGKRK